LLARSTLHFDNPMTRKIKRTPEFDLTLEIKSPRFIATPREAQRNWLLNRAMSEMAADLKALDAVAADFVPGGIEQVAIADRAGAELGDDEIMEDWQLPLMQAMADAATEARGDVLEIGFGRGVSAEMIQQRAPRSHTLVECNASVIARFDAWRAGHSDRDIRMIAGRWQDVIDRMGEYDAIFFHTYPMDEQEYIEHAVNSATYAEHFFATAAAHLRAGGVFTYMTNEIDSLSRAHQRALFAHFSSLNLRVLPLPNLPADIRDTWWAKSMVIVKAVK
jgi:guanidinoacetate N-methyltransferase